MSKTASTWILAVLAIGATYAQIPDQTQDGSIKPQGLPSDTLLSFGDKAPALRVGGWLKGTELKIDPKKITVVELFASWIPESKQSAELISTLSAKHKNKFVAVGVAVWESDVRADDSDVRQFIYDMGSKLSYPIAKDTRDVFMSERWLQPSGEMAVPTAFILKDDKILWFGESLKIQQPLEQIIAGKYDMEAAMEAKTHERTMVNLLQGAQIQAENAARLYKDGKKEEALAIMDDLDKFPPPISFNSRTQRLTMLATDDAEATKAFIDTLLKADPASDTGLVRLHAVASFAGQAVFFKDDEGRTRGELAEYAYSQALKAMKKDDVVALYYLSNVPAVHGRHNEAARLLERALKAFDSSEFKDDETIMPLRGAIVKAWMEAKSKE